MPCGNAVSLSTLRLIHTVPSATPYMYMYMFFAHVLGRSAIQVDEQSISAR